jgi:hypothetical protein
LNMISSLDSSPNSTTTIVSNFSPSTFSNSSRVGFTNSHTKVFENPYIAWGTFSSSLLICYSSMSLKRVSKLFIKATSYVLWWPKVPFFMKGNQVLSKLLVLNSQPCIVLLIFSNIQTFNIPCCV